MIRLVRIHNLRLQKQRKRGGIGGKSRFLATTEAQCICACWLSAFFVLGKHFISWHICFERTHL